MSPHYHYAVVLIYWVLPAIIVSSSVFSLILHYMTFAANLYHPSSFNFSHVPLHGDNFNANNLANNNANSSRTRHIALRERFVSEKASEGLVHILKIDTFEQIADTFTKPVRKDVLRKHAISLGVELPQFVLICTLCSQGFDSNNLLHKHLRSVHDTPPSISPSVASAASFWSKLPMGLLRR